MRTPSSRKSVPPSRQTNRPGSSVSKSTAETGLQQSGSLVSYVERKRDLALQWSPESDSCLLFSSWMTAFAFPPVGPATERATHRAKPQISCGVGFRRSGGRTQNQIAARGNSREFASLSSDSRFRARFFHRARASCLEASFQTPPSSQTSTSFQSADHSSDHARVSMIRFLNFGNHDESAASAQPSCKRLSTQCKTGT